MRKAIANKKEGNVRRLLILAAALAAALSVGVATSGAAPETPNGYCGAMNMSMAGAGMEHAMTVNNPNGSAGMFRAVDRSACEPSP